MVWDSASVTDGEHKFRLIVTDRRNGSVISVVDNFTIQASNGKKLEPEKPVVTAVAKVDPPKSDIPKAEPPKIEPTKEVASTPKQPAGEPSASSTKQPAETIEKSAPIVITNVPARPVAKQPTTSTVSKTAAKPSGFKWNAASPFSGAVTSITVSGKMMLLGRPNGSLSVVDQDGKSGSQLTPAQSLPRVTSAIQVGESTYWLTTEPYSLCVASHGSQDVEVVDVSIYLPAARGMDWRMGRMDGAAVVWNQRSVWKVTAPEHRLMEVPLPSGLSSVAAGVEFGTETNGEIVAATALAARTDSENETTRSIALWHWRKGGWARERTVTLPTSVSADAPVLIDNGWIVVADSQRVACSPTKGESNEFTLRDWVECGVTPDSLDRVACNESGVWIASRDRLLRLGGDLAQAEAYMPWNSSIGTLSAVTSDGKSIWLATDQGARKLDPAHAERDNGYAGFIRVPLGEGSGGPRTPRERRLAELCEEWQGTPYVWGGSSRKGTDCSGFVMSVFDGIGVSLPHGSDNLRSMKSGAIVKDELQFGDVLVYPGHVALYMGDGRTAETVRGKGVSYGTIWGRRSVVVRRYLGADGPEMDLPSRKGKLGGRRASESSAKSKKSDNSGAKSKASSSKKRNAESD
jgi:hypothetical protein